MAFQTNIGGTSGDVVSGNSTLPLWTKYTVAFGALATSGLTNNIELFSLAAKTSITGVITKHSASFIGGIIAAYTISVGIAGSLLKYSTAFDVFQAPGDTVKLVKLNLVQDVESFASATSIKISAVSVAANLDAATAGSVDVWVRTERLL